ncbi:MAG: hypothetical protein PHY56_00595 [Candidatus Omnitrophica bacterium]|jgi:hypothetical protein|nr:hypothetical protein [Candidatus Omnitrophota bacterium]
MNHTDLVKISEKWLRRSMNCGVVIAELITWASETPDAIGFKNGISILIECKMSRQDFLMDKKKTFRILPETGMGTYRYYICPEGLIKEDDLPPKWGLLYVDDKGKVKKVIGPVKHNKHIFVNIRNMKAEQLLLVSALRRYQNK